MSVWDRVRNILRTAREATDLPRRLISGISRLGRGSAVTRTVPRSPLAKFSVHLTYRPTSGPTGTEEILEVAVPEDLLPLRMATGDLWQPSGPSTLGAWIREQFYHDEGYVLIHGIQKVGIDVPATPRLSLPRALPELRKDPVRSAERALRLIPQKADEWYGLITLDLDDVEPVASSVRAWARRVGMGRSFEWRGSASGEATHVRFKIREGIRPRAALALRLALGDDPVRAAIDASRYAYHGRSAVRGVLFDEKNGGTAGPWHSSRKTSRRRKKGGSARGR